MDRAFSSIAARSDADTTTRNVRFRSRVSGFIWCPFQWRREPLFASQSKMPSNPEGVSKRLALMAYTLRVLANNAYLAVLLQEN